VDLCFFFSSRRRHTRFSRDWSSDVALPILQPPEQKTAKEEYVQELIRSGLLREKERWITEMIRPERLMRMHQVLNQRTRYISVLLEAIDDGHNQAAVLRSADAFGEIGRASCRGDGGMEVVS